MTSRFRDDHKHLDELAREFLVACPRCAARALVRRRPSDVAAHDALAVLTCVACGHSATTSAARTTIDGARDWFFGLPLWLQAPCCGETLWAYNAEHLEYLEAYVGATLRRHVHDAERGWSNASVASRLPTWLTSSKNRAAVLGCLEFLRDERLPRAKG